MESEQESVEDNLSLSTIENSDYTAWLNELCPYYMSIGVSYEEFWYGDYTKLKFYEQANLLTIEKRNQESWLQGLYIYNAVGVVVGNALAKKGTKPQKYLEKPMRITPMTEQEKAEEAKKTEQKIIAQLNAWEKSWNLTHKGGD